MQTSAFEYLRHGQTPFFRLPSVTWPAEPVDAIVLGVPHDGGTTYQPGARFAPYHVRRTSALVQSYHPVHRIDVFARLEAVDAGNVVFPPFDRAAMRAAVGEMIGDAYAMRATPFVIGGDHSVTAPILRAAATAHGPLAVLHIDAHLDTSGPETWGDDHHHGTPLRHAIGEGSIAPGALASIGIRGSWGAPDESDLVRRHDALIATPDDVVAHGIPRLVAQLRERFAGKPLYITVDVDGLDPAFAPGTGTPVPGGLSTREVLAILRGLAGLHVVGMDVVEISPALDHADLTCHLGAHLLYEGLALRAVRG
ncbi:MAG: agmatinase [Deltaproteobacteria bacterium]|nr:agmatinase [Deltaproteobacteria bacterium]